MTRNVYSRKRQSVQAWLKALEDAASEFAARHTWGSKQRYAAAIEIRIPWSADIDNYIKDILDRSSNQGVFGGDDEPVDLVHAIKRSGIPHEDSGARIEIWIVE